MEIVIYSCIIFIISIYWTFSTISFYTIVHEDEDNFIYTLGKCILSILIGWFCIPIIFGIEIGENFKDKNL